MKATSNHKRVSAASILLLATLSTYCNAEVVSVDITAIVEYIDDHQNYLGGKVEPGDSITGTYIYDTATVDTNTMVNVGDYEHTAAGFGVSLNVAGVKFKSNPTTPRFLLELVDNHNSSDTYLFHSYNNVFEIAAPLNPVGELHNNMISWQLDDATEQALGNVLLTDQPPQLSAWKSVFGLMIHSRSMAGNFLIRAHVTSAVKGSNFCAVEPIETTKKYISSTLLYRRPFISEIIEAVLYKTTGGYSISTRNMLSGVIGREMFIPDDVGFKAIGFIGVKDTNANNYPDIALLYTNSEEKYAYIRIVDSNTDATTRVIDGFNSQFMARSLRLIPDLNQNGYEEIAVLFETVAGNGSLETVDSKTGAVISRRMY